MKGRQNYRLGEWVMDLFMMIDLIIPKASRMFSENAHVPCVRSLQRHKKRADTSLRGNEKEVPITCHSIDESTRIIFSDHKIMFVQKTILHSHLLLIYPRLLILCSSILGTEAWLEGLLLITALNRQKSHHYVYQRVTWVERQIHQTHIRVIQRR